MWARKGRGPYLALNPLPPRIRISQSSHQSIVNQIFCSRARRRSQTTGPVSNFMIWGCTWKLPARSSTTQKPRDAKKRSKEIWASITSPRSKMLNNKMSNTLLGFRLNNHKKKDEPGQSTIKLDLIIEPASSPKIFDIFIYIISGCLFAI